jgi:hypothetical protein
MLMIEPLPAFAHRRPEFLAREQHATNEVEVEVRSPVLERDCLEWILSGHGYPRIISTLRRLPGWSERPRLR